MQSLSKQQAGFQQGTTISDEEDHCNETDDIMNVEIGIQTDDLPRSCKYGCDLIEGNDAATKFYTGLPTWNLFMLIFDFVAPFIPRIRKSKSKLTLQDELLIVLTRLRLILPF